MKKTWISAHEAVESVGQTLLDVFDAFVSESLLIARKKEEHTWYFWNQRNAGRKKKLFEMSRGD